MKKILLNITIMLFSVCLFSQDIHLSQYYTNQQNLNPALIGNYNGMYRVVSNYRNQWKQIGGDPITTSIIAFDHKFYYYSDEITGGVMVVNDQFSDYGLNTTKIQLAGSYKKIILAHELRAGVQVGYVLKSTNLSNQSFPNQWVYERGTFDRDIFNGEGGIKESQSYVDINAGLAWSKSFANFKPSLGVSFYHINTPKDSYYDDENSERSLTSTYHLSVFKALNVNYSIEPKASYWRSVKAQNLVFGANVYKKVQNHLLTRVQAGLLYRDGFGRNTDAIIPLIGATYKRFDFGVSYDFNVGKLSKFSNGKGTFELSLVYTAPAFLPKKLSIPCDRY